jgi:acetyltransferase-like isoleucine patch superfamily enzyme
VIALGAVVTKDTPSNGIYVGQPAKLFKAADETTEI